MKNRWFQQLLEKLQGVFETNQSEKEWLQKAIQGIEERKGVNLEALEESGTLNIEGKTESCYFSIFGIEEIIEEVYLFACQKENRLILFYNFLLEGDCKKFPEDVEQIRLHGTNIMNWN